MIIKRTELEKRLRVINTPTYQCEWCLMPFEWKFLTADTSLATLIEHHHPDCPRIDDDGRQNTIEIE
jgi:hypothetical protein